MPAPAAAAGIYILQTYDFTEPHGYWPNTWLNYNQLKKKKKRTQEMYPLGTGGNRKVQQSHHLS